MLKFLIIFYLFIGIVLIMGGFQEFSKKGLNFVEKIFACFLIVIFWPLILIYFGIQNIYKHVSK